MKKYLIATIAIAILASSVSADIDQYKYKYSYKGQELTSILWHKSDRPVDQQWDYEINLCKQNHKPLEVTGSCTVIQTTHGLALMEHYALTTDSSYHRWKLTFKASEPPESMFTRTPRE